MQNSSFPRRETELHANIEARKTFTQQATENEMVLEELKSLEEGASVYKLIGPMLAKQDVVEATSNVTKRLEFINAERTRLEKAAEAIEKKFDQTQKDIQILQQRIAQLSTANAAGAVDTA
jgi:prefoldin beta subunit